MDENRSSRVGTLFQKVLAYAIVIAALVLALKLFGVFFVGFFQSILSIFLIVVVIGAVFWALRRL